MKQELKEENKFSKETNALALKKGHYECKLSILTRYQVVLGAEASAPSGRAQSFLGHTTWSKLGGRHRAHLQLHQPHLQPSSPPGWEAVGPLLPQRARQREMRSHNRQWECSTSFYPLFFPPFFLPPSSLKSHMKQVSAVNTHL